MKRTFALAVAMSVLAFAIPAGTAHAQDRFGIGAHVAIHHLPELGETRTGYGFRFISSSFLPFIAFDSELNFFPTSSTGNLGETQLFVGLKGTVKVSKFGVFLKARPGFSHFSGGATQQRLTERTKFAMDFGGGLEYYLIPHVALRWDLSDVLIHYGSARVLAGPGDAIGIPLGNRANFQTTIGVVIGF